MALNSHWPTQITCNERWQRIGTVFLIVVAALPGLARHRAVGKPATLGAVLGQEAVVTNYGDAPVSVQRCVAETCETEQLSPGAAKRYAITGPVMRIGQVSTGTIDVTTDGITLPSVLFLQNTKIIPGAYDLQAFRQRIGIVSDWAGAISVKSIAHNGTIQDLRSVRIDRGVTYFDPSAVFSVEPNFQFEITDTVAAFAEWTNTTTGQVTRIPAVRVEDALNEAYLARVTPTTTLLVKNALLVQQGGVNLWFLPAAGIAVPTLVRGTNIMPYAMISTTDIPAFAGGTGDGSLKITGAPEGQNLLPFYAWAFNDGIPYPLTRFQQAATGHGPGADPTPYQNARWTGLRTDATHHTALVLQNIDYQTNTGILTLDDQGTTFAGQTISLGPYASQQLTLDNLAGSHAVYSATLQLNNDPNNVYYHTPRVTGAAIVTTPASATARAPVIATREATANVTAEQYVALWMPNDSIWLNPFEAKDLLTRYKHEFATELSNTPNSPGITFIESYLADLVDGVISTSNEELWGNGDPLLISIPAGKVEFYKINEAGSTVRVDDISLPLDALQRIRDNIVRPELTYRVRTSPTSYGGSTSRGPRLSFNPTWTTQDAAFVTAQAYVDHFLLPLQNNRAYLNLVETRCMLTGACGVRSYALDLATIIQPNYTSSWASPEALAAQLQAWVDGNDANGELFEGRDPFSYVNTGSPVGVGFLMKPLGGAVPFNLSAAQMRSAFAALRSFLIEYVAAHPEAYGRTANGYSLSIDPTWSSQDAIQKVTGEQYVAKWLDPVRDRHFNLTYKEFARLLNGSQNTRSYLDDLTSEIWNDPKVVSAFANKDALKQWFLQRADGNPDNIEFCATAANWAHDVGLATYGGSSCNPVYFAPGAVVTNNDLYGTLRSYLVANIDANPADYGGSAQLGPDINFHPPWY